MTSPQSHDASVTRRGVIAAGIGATALVLPSAAMAASVAGGGATPNGGDFENQLVPFHGTQHATTFSANSVDVTSYAWAFRLEDDLMAEDLYRMRLQIPAEIDPATGWTIEIRRDSAGIDSQVATSPGALIGTLASVSSYTADGTYNFIHGGAGVDETDKKFLWFWRTSSITLPNIAPGVPTRVYWIQVKGPSLTVYQPAQTGNSRPYKWVTTGAYPSDGQPLSNVVRWNLATSTLDTSVNYAPYFDGWMQFPF